MSKKCFNILSKELFNVFWDEKQNDLCSSFDWDKLWFFHKFLFLSLHILGLDLIWNGQSFRMPCLHVKY